MTRAVLDELTAKACSAFADALARGDYVKAERFATIAMVLSGSPAGA